MPLIAWAVLVWVGGTVAGATLPRPVPTVVAVVIACSWAWVLRHPARVVLVALGCLGATALTMSWRTRLEDRRCRDRAMQAEDWRSARSPTPCAGRPTGWSARLAAAREAAGQRIDRDFREDAPLARALLIADTRDLPLDLRDRFASAGLVHILSISGLHVAIIAQAIALVLAAARLGPRTVSGITVVVIAGYVAMIGAPPPAVRSVVMLAVTELSRALQRPTSPWAILALGAVAPLVDPRVATDLGWQLSVAGFAALIAGGRLARRILPRRWRGWRLAIARELVIALVAMAVTAPLVAWAFGRVSLVAPLSNLIAGPIVAVLQPTLFLALSLSQWPSISGAVAAAAHPMLLALDAVAVGSAALPGAALSVAPSIVVAIAGGAASVALLVAATSRHPGRALFAGATALCAVVWWPLLPAGSGAFEIHLLDVGQGDAIALRTPHGRWILVDAGRTWRGGDAARSTIVPYLRRYGGPLEWLILSHPHADHVGGAATVIRLLRPQHMLDAAFAGGSQPYRAALEAAAEGGVPWERVRTGRRLVVDGVVLELLAPDSAWTASLDDPNLASTVLTARYGERSILLTGDAEAAEEQRLLDQGAVVRADILKVGHHGSATSSTAAFLDAVVPRIALVSVGTPNGYGHPSPTVMRDLRSRGVLVLRTDQLGTVVLRTDGRALDLEVAGQRAPVGR